MRLARSAVLGFVVGAALVTSRGLFAQAPSQAPAEAGPFVAPVVAADQLPERLRFDVRYVQPEPLLIARPRAIKALYVNAWAFGSNKLWHLVRLADSTEINALVVDVKDDTGCLLYKSNVKVARDIGATRCIRARDARARLDTLHEHDIYAIARIVIAKDPLLAEHRPQWSVQQRDVGGLWRDRIGSAWVDAYNDSVWIYAAQIAEEAVHMGFDEVQFDYVRFPDEPREAMANAVFPARRHGETQRAAVRASVAKLAERLQPLGVPVTFDIFGLTASATGDLGIGQVWEDFISVADVVL